MNSSMTWKKCLWIVLIAGVAIELSRGYFTPRLESSSHARAKLASIPYPTKSNCGLRHARGESMESNLPRGCTGHADALRTALVARQHMGRDSKGGVPHPAHESTPNADISE
jgi:hypothetical protein